MVITAGTFEQSLVMSRDASVAQAQAVLDNASRTEVLGACKRNDAAFKQQQNAGNRKAENIAQMLRQTDCGDVSSQQNAQVALKKHSQG